MSRHPVLDNPLALLTLYTQWLAGKSLRAIAGTVTPKVSHSTLGAWFKAAYGDHATDPLAMSLARSVMSDYQDSPEVSQGDLLAFALSLLDNPETVKHRSKHSLQQLTRFQAAHTDTILDTLAVSKDTPWDYVESLECSLDFLRLPLVELWLDILVDILADFLGLNDETPGVDMDTIEVAFKTLCNLPPKGWFKGYCVNPSPNQGTIKRPRESYKLNGTTFTHIIWDDYLDTPEASRDT